MELSSCLERVSSRILVHHSVPGRFGASSWLKSWDCDRHDRCAIIMVCERGCGCLPDGLASRFAFYRLGPEDRCHQEKRQDFPGDVDPPCTCFLKPDQLPNRSLMDNKTFFFTLFLVFRPKIKCSSLLWWCVFLDQWKKRIWFYSFFSNLGFIFCIFFAITGALNQTPSGEEERTPDPTAPVLLA